MGNVLVLLISISCAHYTYLMATSDYFVAMNYYFVATI